MWRVDLDKRTSSGTLLKENVALPIVARVATSSGPRVLVAGGVELPMKKGNDIPRRGETLLCSVEAGSADCVEAKAKLATGRANAASACLETSADGCKRLLIVGGRVKSGAPLAEVYDASTETYEKVTVKGTVPAASHGGDLVRAGDRFYLLGATANALFIEGRTGASAGSLAPMQLTIDDSGDPLEVTFAAVDLGKYAGTDKGARAMATAFGFDDGSALLVGGLGPKNAIQSDAILIDKDGKGAARLTLEKGRYGASAARIGGSGPVAGCVLLVGGVGSENGSVVPLSHVEVYCPPVQ